MTRQTQFTHYGGILAATAFGQLDQIAIDMTVIDLHHNDTPDIFGFNMTQHMGIAWDIGQEVDTLGDTTEAISGAGGLWLDDGATVGYGAVLTAYGGTPSGLTYGAARGLVEAQSIEGNTGEGRYKHQIGFDLQKRG